MCTYVYISLSLSLYLSIYIYIYTYIPTQSQSELTCAYLIAQFQHADWAGAMALLTKTYVYVYVCVCMLYIYIYIYKYVCIHHVDTYIYIYIYPTRNTYAIHTVCATLSSTQLKLTISGLVDCSMNSSMEMKPSPSASNSFGRGACCASMAQRYLVICAQRQLLPSQQFTAACDTPYC